MAIELNAHQQQALHDQQEYPPRVVNPQTKESFVLVPLELYERVRALLEAEDEIGDIRATYPLVGRVLESDAGGAAKESA